MMKGGVKTMSIKTDFKEVIDVFNQDNNIKTTKKVIEFAWALEVIRTEAEEIRHSEAEHD